MLLRKKESKLPRSSHEENRVAEPQQERPWSRRHWTNEKLRRNWPFLTLQQVELLREVFDNIDKEGKGYFTKDELYFIMESMGGSPTPQELDAVMFELDSNNDHVVDFPEFLTKFMKATEEKELLTVFDRLAIQEGTSGDNSKVLTLTAVERSFAYVGDALSDVDKQYLKQIFDGADKDGNGRLDIKEFTAYLEKMDDDLHNGRLGVNRQPDGAPRQEEEEEDVGKARGILSKITKSTKKSGKSVTGGSSVSIGKLMPSIIKQPPSPYISGPLTTPAGGAAAGGITSPMGTPAPDGFNRNSTNTGVIEGDDGMRSGTLVPPSNQTSGGGGQSQGPPSQKGGLFSTITSTLFRSGSAHSSSAGGSADPQHLAAPSSATQLQPVPAAVVAGSAGGALGSSSLQSPFYASAVGGTSSSSMRRSGDTAGGGSRHAQSVSWATGGMAAMAGMAGMHMSVSMPRGRSTTGPSPLGLGISSTFKRNSGSNDGTNLGPIPASGAPGGASVRPASGQPSPASSQLHMQHPMQLHYQHTQQQHGDAASSSNSDGAGQSLARELGSPTHAGSAAAHVTVHIPTMARSSSGSGSRSAFCTGPLPSPGGPAPGVGAGEAASSSGLQQQQQQQQQQHSDEPSPMPRISGSGTSAHSYPGSGLALQGQNIVRIGSAGRARDSQPSLSIIPEADTHYERANTQPEAGSSEIQPVDTAPMQRASSAATPLTHSGGGGASEGGASGSGAGGHSARKPPMPSGPSLG